MSSPYGIHCGLDSAAHHMFQFSKRNSVCLDWIEYLMSCLSGRRNVWPREEFPELEASFKALGSLIIKVGLLLAQHCDKYVEGKGVHPPVKLHHILQDSLCPKVSRAPACGRLRPPTS